MGFHDEQGARPHERTAGAPHAPARRMELLAPAGGREQLEYAIHFGADAVYLAGERYGMRRRSDNFTDDEIADAIAYAHAHGAKVYVTVNALMGDADIDDMPRYFAFLAEAGADAVIVSDVGALSVVRRTAPELAIHVSTQASCMNAEAARAWRELGASRVVLAREMSLEAIAELRRRVGPDMQIEAFVHGAMCMAVSGRCLISDYLTGRSANKGHCAQPCRWEYSLLEPTRPGQRFDVVEDAGTSFIMSSTDMNMLAHVGELAAAGVDSLKIEGRAKGSYYVAAVTNAYRHVVDGEDASAWARELETVSHRPYSTGFYYGYPGQNQTKDAYVRAWQMVACVEACEAQGDAWRVYVACRNRFEEGDELEVLSPACEVRMLRPRDLLWHAAPDAVVGDVLRFGEGTMARREDVRRAPGERLVKMAVASRTMEHYSFVAPFPLKERDILRAPREQKA